MAETTDPAESAAHVLYSDIGNIPLDLRPKAIVIIRAAYAPLLKRLEAASEALKEYTTRGAIGIEGARIIYDLDAALAELRAALKGSE